MGSYFIAILCFTIFTVIRATNGDSNKLQIDIFYESRCPDSRDFLQRQLKKVYPNIKDRVDINYVPFGKARSFVSGNGETLFSCQHGIRECEGNKFQSCVLSQIGGDQDRQTAFVICAMDFSKNPINCARNMGLDMGKITQCENGPLGVQLQLQAEKETESVISRSNFVPTIRYQNNFKAGEFWDSLDNFETVVRDKLASL